MKTTRTFGALLLLGAAAALPACSNMMGGGSSRTATAQPQPLANEMVRQVQAKLQQDGYYKQGAVDGLWGSGTEMAVQNFQRDHNLPVTGKLSLPTLQALNVQPDQTVLPQGNNAANNPPPPPPPPATNR